MKDKLYTFFVGSVMTVIFVALSWGALIVLDRLLKLTGWW